MGTSLSSETGTAGDGTLRHAAFPRGRFFPELPLKFSPGRSAPSLRPRWKQPEHQVHSPGVYLTHVSVTPPLFLKPEMWAEKGEGISPLSTEKKTEAREGAEAVW